jgi:anaerobic magnesium-protoporphyrin IX monomethyl ester cyclase
MTKALLVNPNYFDHIYARNPIRGALRRGWPALNIAQLAAFLQSAGYQAATYDMNLDNHGVERLVQRVRSEAPDLVGFTMTTPMFRNVADYCAVLRRAGYQGALAAGGPHPTALPAETLAATELDFVVTSQGEQPLASLMGGDIDYRHIWRKEGNAVVEGRRDPPLTVPLDDLPFPVFNPEDIAKYRQPRISARRNPVAYLETSRGCPGQCIFCNKKIHGDRFRAKSPRRTVDEIAYLLKAGFREIRVIDDTFSINRKRAKKICAEILKRHLNFTWTCNLRADAWDAQMLAAMHAAGCYKVSFGVESGSPRILRRIDKGITVEQVAAGVEQARQAGLETECFFMIGLPGETERDIRMTRRLAHRVAADYVKFGMVCPMPGTRLFDELAAQGRIRTRDWDRYHFATHPAELYAHDTLTGDQIYRLFRRLNRSYYLRPAYLAAHLIKSLRQGRLLWDVKSAWDLMTR